MLALGCTFVVILPTPASDSALSSSIGLPKQEPPAGFSLIDCQLAGLPHALQPRCAERGILHVSAHCSPFNTYSRRTCDSKSRRQGARSDSSLSLLFHRSRYFGLLNFSWRRLSKMTLRTCYLPRHPRAQGDNGWDKTSSGRCRCTPSGVFVTRNRAARRLLVVVQAPARAMDVLDKGDASYRHPEEAPNPISSIVDAYNKRSPLVARACIKALI
ncbi:hypothetical protein BC834DRAFT_151219 [Gloeopeniophorella convolvens]|nr:hypothetical protein BC834DRAFT_151219 [Gloeopeniophorella convolvens]